jgi:hypothetical protein
MRFRSFIAAAFCVAIVGCAGAGAAFAGEITGPAGPNGGQGHPLYTTDPVTGEHVLQGNSICAFSGLNNPLDGAAAGPGMVQSYGQIVAAGGKASVPSPGVACNGHTGFLAGGGGE